MQVDLAFGRGTLPVNVPDRAEVSVIRKAPRPKLGADAIARALAAPIGSPPLAELVRGRSSACILICDITRPVPNHLFLRPMIELMLAAGIPRERITILIATGLHRPNVGDELAEVVGDPWVLENIRVENHFARNDADHADLGVTETRGTPIKIDRRFVDADLRDIGGRNTRPQRGDQILQAFRPARIGQDHLVPSRDEMRREHLRHSCGRI